MTSKFQVQLMATIDTASTLAEVNKKIAEMEKKFQKLGIKFDVQSIKESNQSLAETSKAVDGVVQKYKLLYTEQSKNIRERIKLETEEKVNTSKRNAKVLDGIRQQIEKHKELTDAMEAAAKSGRSTSDITLEYKSQLDAVNLTLKEQWAQYNANKKEISSLAQASKFAFQEQTKVEKDLIQLQAQRKNNSKAANSAEVQSLELLLRQKQQWISKYNEEIKKKGQVTTKAEEYEERITAINAEISKQKLVVKGLLNEQMSLWDRLTEKAKEYFRYALAAATIQQLGRAVSEMINNVVELDGALVELRKVTDLEGASLDAFTDKAYAAAQNVAKTGKEMIQASTEFAKSGYNPNDALNLGEIALMYTNIADEEISAGDAAGFIISQMKAFNIEAKDAMHIIDAVNETSNRFAVSSADIANNLGKASAVMANAGNSMEQYIAMMTAITEITRSADKAANGKKIKPYVYSDIYNYTIPNPVTLKALMATA